MTDESSRPTIAAPGDWVWVPRVPTREMTEHGDESTVLDVLGYTDEERISAEVREFRLNQMHVIYRAMLSATPTQAPDGVDELCRKMCAAIDDIEGKLADHEAGMINWRPQDWIATLRAAVASSEAEKTLTESVAIEAEEI